MMLIDYIQMCHQLLSLQAFIFKNKMALKNSILLLYLQKMKDKVSQFQKRLRREAIDNYFKSRRMQLLQYRERNSLTLDSSINNRSFSRHYNGWKNIVINGIPPHEQEVYSLDLKNKVRSEVEFQINLTSIEAGEHYLNILVDGAPFQELEQTVYLLQKLTAKVLSPPFKLSFVEEKIQSRILLKILQQIKYYLHIGQQIFHSSERLLFSNGSKIKRVLGSLLDEQYRLLLLKQDSALITELIDISFQLCTTYMIYPNYQLIRYILTRIVIRDNLLPSEIQEKRDNSQKIIFDDKIQELLMKFIIFLKTEENVNRKHKNVHHMQVIHQFYSFIEYNLINIYQFVKNHQYPFDYEHINNSLFFTLNLFTQIINKFKQTLKHHQMEEPALILLKSSIIDRIYDITYIHSRSVIVERQKDQFILTVQQTISKLFRYVIEEMNESRSSFCRPYHQIEEWQINANDRYLLDILTLIKQFLREMEQRSSRS